MIDPALIELLESGSSSIVVGVLDAGGEPFALRAWGITVESAEPMRLRVLLQAGSIGRAGRRAGDGSSFPMAITAADVRTLQALQVKGTAYALEEPTNADLERFSAYVEAFIAAINRTDGNDLAQLRRWAPDDVIPCSVDVDELFDQTPGPSAGAPLGGAR